MKKNIQSNFINWPCKTHNIFELHIRQKNNFHVLAADGWLDKLSQIAKFMGPTWGPSGSCRPQMGPMSAPWTLLPGALDEWSSHNFKACAFDGSRWDASNDSPNKSYPIWHSPAIEYKFFNIYSKQCHWSTEYKFPNIYPHMVNDWKQKISSLKSINLLCKNKSCPKYDLQLVFFYQH